MHLTVQLQKLNMNKFCLSFLLLFFPYTKTTRALTAFLDCACPSVIFFIVLRDLKEWRWLVTPWSVEKLNIITSLPKLTCRTLLTDNGLCFSFSTGKWYLEYFCTLKKSYIQINQFYKYLRHHSDYENWKLIAQSQLTAKSASHLNGGELLAAEKSKEFPVMLENLPILPAGSWLEPANMIYTIVHLRHRNLMQKTELIPRNLSSSSFHTNCLIICGKNTKAEER